MCPISCNSSKIEEIENLLLQWNFVWIDSIFLHLQIQWILDNDSFWQLFLQNHLDNKMILSGGIIPLNKTYQSKHTI